MFGHLERTTHWARHLLRVRDLQEQTQGFTEFVPLPFVHMHAPIHQTGLTRPGPTWREALLMHAVSRLTLHPLITNIQASWVKLGEAGVAHCLQAGVNDLGGSLMNESITRAAGAAHGQEFPPQQFEALAHKVNRRVRQRTTLYRDVIAERAATSFVAQPLSPPVNSNIRRGKSTRPQPPLRFGSS
jgi:FO synthase